MTDETLHPAAPDSTGKSGQSSQLPREEVVAALPAAHETTPDKAANSGAPQHQEEEEEDAPDNSHFRILVNAVSFVANEPLLLARYQSTSPEDFPRLHPSDPSQTQAFNERVNHVIEHLGGPPPHYLVQSGMEHLVPAADRYPEAAMTEAFAVFDRARTSVIRTHLFCTGSSLLSHNVDLLESWSQDKAVQQQLVNQSVSAFWEHAEAAYIRLHSFWDRVGQVLDFAFFNIRRFEHNGFSAVMDRIHANVRPMRQDLATSASWERLRAFQGSTKDDGLKWLLERRNLLVHSLHLHPLREADEGVFKSQFNHLDQAHRDKLKPRSPHDEVDLLLGQLRRAATLFDDFLSLLEFSSSRKHSRFL